MLNNSKKEWPNKQVYFVLLRTRQHHCKCILLHNRSSKPVASYTNTKEKQSIRCRTRAKSTQKRRQQKKNNGNSRFRTRIFMIICIIPTANARTFQAQKRIMGWCDVCAMLSIPPISVIVAHKFPFVNRCVWSLLNILSPSSSTPFMALFLWCVLCVLSLPMVLPISASLFFCVVGPSNDSEPEFGDK